MYWVHSINFIIYAVAAFWNFILIKYLDYTDNKCNISSKDKKYKKTIYIVLCIIFVILCIGGIISLLEMIGIIKKNYKLNIV
jgi:hypothetical protein